MKSNNIDPDIFSIGIFSRVEEQKGQHLVLDAMNMSCNQMQLCIIGHVMSKQYKEDLLINAKIYHLTNYLKFVMGFSAFGFLFNMSTVLMLYINTIQVARLNFAACCICMIISIFLFLQEIRLSNQALKFHLSENMQRLLLSQLLIHNLNRSCS